MALFEPLAVTRTTRVNKVPDAIKKFEYLVIQPSRAIGKLTILRNYPFSEGAKFLAILAAFNLLLIGLYFGTTSTLYMIALDEDMQQELHNTGVEFERRGLEAVVEYLDEMDMDGRRYNYAYLLVDSAGNLITGQLDPDERYVRFRDISVFNYWVRQTRDEDQWNSDFFIREVRFESGAQLTMGLYMGDRHQGFMGLIESVVFLFSLTFIAGIILMYSQSRGYHRQLGQVNRDIDIVMEGNLSHRLHVGRKDTGFDILVQHVNEMLDRIQMLMEGVKQVSDNIAHDLRTPLTRLRNNLVSYERRAEGSDKDNVRALIVEADGLIATFNSLLRIAKIELGEVSQQRYSVRLQDLVYEVVELYEPLADEKGIAIDTTLDHVEVSAERNLIFQAVANLIDNAIKYTPSQGKISIRVCRSADGDPVIEITDTGPGIQEKNLRKVFQRFFREDSSRTLEAGNGLGLSLVAAVLKIHGAQIKLENRHPGLAVTVTF